MRVDVRKSRTTEVILLKMQGDVRESRTTEAILLKMRGDVRESRITEAILLKMRGDVRESRTTARRGKQSRTSIPSPGRVEHDVRYCGDLSAGRAELSMTCAIAAICRWDVRN